MLDFLMVPLVVGIICAGIYGLFELFVRRKERLAIIEKIGEKLDASAFEAVNRVRRRVGMPELQSTDATSPTYCGTQDALRQRIRNEWRVEFALEGDKRQWDIRRWGIASQVLNQPILGLKYTLVNDPEHADPADGGQVCILYQGTNVVAGTTAYSEHNYLYPVPQSEIDLNPALGQNPGY